MPAQSSHTKSKVSDFCFESFLLGQSNKNNCTDANVHSLILREAECREAAAEANAQTGNGQANFVVDYDNKDNHPIGCFKDADKNIFWFNPDGDWPKHPEGETRNPGGTPVCSRKRYLNGTLPSTCPAGYTAIQEEEACRSIAECEGYCMSSVFRVGIPAATNAVKNPPDPRPAWAADYNKMPKGCFIREEDGCVYFNKPRAAAPTSPAGIPLCSISTWSATFF